MESIKDIESAKNDVMRKIGRNVLSFQELEYLLKFLLANGKIAGYSREIKANLEKQADEISKQTLGKLVKAFIENHHNLDSKLKEHPDDPKGVFFTLGFNVECNETFYDEKKALLEKMVADRNFLIHNLLSRYDENSVESCLETIQFLDQQNERITREINNIEKLIDSFQKLRDSLFSFLKSDEGKNILFSDRPTNSVADLLAEIAKQTARKDGWTLLDMAGQRISEEYDGKLNHLYQEYGQKTLKGLILSTGKFEIKKEPTPKGGVRLLYRRKPKVPFQCSISVPHST